jgi:hypothetical protein
MALSWLNRLLGRNDLEVLDHCRDTDPGEGDSKVLSEMLKRNADLTRPRHTIFYLYFTSAESAFTAAERLLQMGYEANAAKKNPAAGGRPWPVIAEKTYIVNEETMAHERLTLSQVAEELVASSMAGKPRSTDTAAAVLTIGTCRLSTTISL